MLGLSEQEVLNRLEKFGYNELKDDVKTGSFQIILGILKEPMVLILLGIGVIYISLGELEEIYSLLTFLILIIGISFYQEQKTEHTLRTLKDLSSPRAVVIREGKQKRIPGREVVPGDIIILNEGDRVPADIQLLEGAPLSVDESIITGESFAVDKSYVLSGTLVLKGQALGEVKKTGQETELGKIGKGLEAIQDEATQLQKSTRKAVTRISILVGILTIFISTFYWITRHELMEGILTGLTLAMAILPNELPAVLLIFLAAGAWRISKRKVLTRKVPSVEALGSITYLCTDKTGTLTQNKMILKILWNQKERLNTTEFKDELPESFHELMEFGTLAIPRDPFDPMEKAIQSASFHFLKNTEHLHPDWKLSKEYQITSELLAVSYAWKGDGSEFMIGAKGATEAIIDLCHLSQEQIIPIETEMISLASQGLRVLAVARAISGSLPANQHDLTFEFLGLVGFEDPIRPDAREAVEECQSAGIKVLMITGDHPATARNIAEQIGLKNSQEVLTGSELEKMEVGVLKQKVKEVQIFCRMKPLDKLKIVSTLQEAGEIVAMTGDGVNDAPSLRKADVGIAMGERGTDVAREAASIVLLDDSFASIVAAIRIGRRTYKNLQDAFEYLLGIHIPITLLSIVPVMFKLPLMLLPVHIAFLHLIIEPVSTMLFENRTRGEELMKAAPRSKHAPILSRQKFLVSFSSGLLISIAVLGVFLLAHAKGMDPSDTRGLTFTTLILTNLFYMFIMSGRESRKLILLFTLGSVALLALVIYVPFFQELFRFQTLHPNDLLVCILVSAVTGLGLRLARR